MTKTNKYPFFIERGEMAPDKRFDNELCHHTGRAIVYGPLPEDVWNEYVNSNNELHYGR